MTRLFPLSAAALFAAVVGANSASAADAPKTNIVFILVDDMGINDLSCYGRKDQPTPNIDKLAAQGARFTCAYAQPVCSPTRACLLTGKDCARLHITTFLPGRGDAPSQLLLHPKIETKLPADVKTVAERLKPAGYATAAIGKWHLGGKGALPSDRGFDLYFPGHAQTKPSATEGGKGEYELTARAEQFLDDNKDKPFFLYLAHNTPHVALGAKPELIEKHKDAFNPVYAAMMESMDECVGRVLKKLEDLKLADRTLVVFMSDNGGLHVHEGPNTPATFNAPYRAGKGFVYEGGLRVSLVVRWPGHVKEGQTIAAPVHVNDWTPTLLDVAGVPAAGEKFDGVSLVNLLTKGEAPAARTLCWHMPHYMNQGSRPAGAVREGDWKLVEHYEDGRCELFNLAADIGEADDLAAKEPGRVADLRGKLEKWRREVGAQENTANPKFNAGPWRKLYFETDVSKLAAEPTAAVMFAKLDPWRKLMNDVVAKDAKATPKYDGAGAVILRARDAKVHGKNLRYEDPPHKDTVGFWTKPDDWVEWEFDAPGPGTFEVEILQGCGKGSGGAKIEIAVAGQTIRAIVEETGHFQRFVPRVVGTVKFDAAGRQTLSVKAVSKPGPAVMDLRRVTLRAAP